MDLLNNKLKYLSFLLATGEKERGISLPFCLFAFITLLISLTILYTWENDLSFASLSCLMPKLVDFTQGESTWLYRQKTQSMTAQSRWILGSRGVQTGYRTL
jgi:hypothetical protein